MTTPNATQYALLQAESVIEQALNFADDRAFDVLRSYGRLDNLTLNTQKAIEKDRTIRDPKVRLWTLNFVYSPTNPMFTQKNVKEYIADLPNPTEAGEK